MRAPELRAGVRASDAERERIAQILQGAAAEGRLSPEEAGERLAAASGATYREELYRLIVDLPVAPERAAGASPWRLWSIARVAFVVMLIIGVASWGLRFLWPWGLFALVIFGRPWRRRWHAGWHWYARG